MHKVPTGPYLEIISPRALIIFHPSLFVAGRDGFSTIKIKIVNTCIKL